MNSRNGSRGLRPARPPRRLLLGFLAFVMAAIAVQLVRAGAVHRVAGGLQLDVAGFQRNYYFDDPGLFLAWLGGAVFLALTLSRRVRDVVGRLPFPARVVALGAALFIPLELAFARLMRLPLLLTPMLFSLGVLTLLAAWLLLRGGPGPDSLARLGDWLRVGRMRVAGVWLFLLGTAVSLAGWQLYFGGHNQMVDSISQIAQARLLRLGRFTLDIPQPLRDVINFPSATATVPSYSQFPPGYLVLMPPPIAAGVPVQWINIVLSGGLVALTAALARRLAGRAAGVAAGVLMALSPFYVAVAGTAMNHVPAALALFGAAWCFLPGGRERLAARGVLGGLLLGWAATIRPLSAFAHGIAWCIVWAVRLWPGPYRRTLARGPLLRHIALAGLGLVPPALFFMFYNLQTTGHPLVMPYSANNPELHRLGFAFEGPYRYMPGDAIEQLAADLLDFNSLLLGWGIGSWLAGALWLARTRLSRGERVLLTLIGCQVFFYGLYSYHHLVLGPRFWFEVLPFMIVLLAVGLAPLLRRGGRTAGTLAVVLLCLSIGGTLIGLERFAREFGPGRLRHDALERYMEAVLPVRRPTVIVFDPAYIDHIGRWFPHDPGRPELWFVSAENAERARALPELADCDWLTLDLNATPPQQGE